MTVTAIENAISSNDKRKYVTCKWFHGDKKYETLQTVNFSPESLVLVEDKD